MHGLTHHLRVHRTNYRNCSVSTVRNINVLFTPHGLPKVNLIYIAWKLQNLSISLSVVTARTTEIAPFTPHGIQLSHLHLMAYQKLISIYTAWK